MEIIYSHIKEPIRKGKTPAEVFIEFQTKILAEDTTPEAKKASIENLKSAIGLAWDEIRPIAIMNRNANYLEEKRAAAPQNKPDNPNDHYCG
jgi:hypothetical protein